MQRAFPNDFFVSSDLSGGYKHYPALNIRVNHSMLMTYLSPPLGICPISSQGFSPTRPYAARERPVAKNILFQDFCLPLSLEQSICVQVMYSLFLLF